MERLGLVIQVLVATSVLLAERSSTAFFHVQRLNDSCRILQKFLSSGAFNLARLERNLPKAFHSIRNGLGFVDLKSVCNPRVAYAVCKGTSRSTEQTTCPEYLILSQRFENSYVLGSCSHFRQGLTPCVCDLGAAQMTWRKWRCRPGLLWPIAISPVTLWYLLCVKVWRVRNAIQTAYE